MEMANPDPDKMNLKVAGQDGSIVDFKVKKNVPLVKLMQAYCKHKGLSMDLVRFHLDEKRITKGDTVLTLGMEEDDTIDVFQRQISGGDGRYCGLWKALVMTDQS